MTVHAGSNVILYLPNDTSGATVNLQEGLGFWGGCRGPVRFDADIQGVIQRQWRVASAGA
jgi:hypothetical protein